MHPPAAKPTPHIDELLSLPKKFPMKKPIILCAFVLMMLASCSPEPPANMILFGGNIYTVDATAPTAEAVAVRGDSIIFVGSRKDAQKFKGEKTMELDLKGQTMTPGFIEGHGHIMGLGYNEMNLDLMFVKSYDELVQKVKEAVAKAQPGEWIIGRGWHQDKWEVKPPKMIKGFQTHQFLSSVSPDNPVYLSHASGHAGFANAKAMGEIIRDELGNPTGIFNERAQSLISQFIPAQNEESNAKAFELAMKACQRNGITSFQDAGTNQVNIDLFKKYKAEGKLGVRVYTMLTGSDEKLMSDWFARGPEIDARGWLTIRSIKLHCDGALGSRGAWLLEPYTDRPGHTGHETLPMEFVYTTSQKALNTGFQVCSHAIGDRANKEILDRYEKAFAEDPAKAKDVRFRIEHAQHLHPDDIPRFGKLGVIPAMQAIHLSSDRPWAIDRLGEKRIVEGAYVWKKLLESGAVIVNGTDVPVEPINPIASFYASVSRKTLTGEPEGGYEPEQKMTREQALKSYTLDAAFGAFEESIKGSIKSGKLADFTVFTKDIMKIDERELLSTEVAMTIVGGKVVYQK
jgi:predicted amidohydrolase YtcJ